MSRDETALLDILKAARLALEFKGDIPRDAFLNDHKTQSAVLHQLLLLGEAVKRLSDAFKTKHPQLPWKIIAGMRNKLIHEYNDVDIHEIWKTLTSDIPELITGLEPLIPKEDA